MNNYITFNKYAYTFCISMYLILNITALAFADTDVYKKEAQSLFEINQKKAERVKLFFDNAADNITKLSADMKVRKAFHALRDLYYHLKSNEGGLRDGKSIYIYNSQNKYMESILNKYEYNDILFIDSKKNVIYTVAKDKDFGEYLEGDLLSKTLLNKEFKNLLNGRQVLDFSLYLHNRPSCFVTHPIKESETTIGVIVIEIPIHKINEIMHDRSGLGSTGDSFLIGTDGFLRSDSFMYPEYTVEKCFSSSKFIADRGLVKHLLKKSGRRVTVDLFYEQNEVLQVYNKFSFLGTTWIIISDKDILEIVSGKS